MSPQPEKLGESRYSILILAASTGLLTGLVEGALFLILQELGWWHWSMAEAAVTREILWISPVFDLLLFAFVGAVLQFAQWIFPSWPLRRIAFFMFAFMASLDWLLASGKISHLPVLVLAVGIAATAFRLWPRIGARAEFAAGKALPALVMVTVLLCFGAQGSLWWKESQAVAAARARSGSNHPPNILVIVIDTLRADHVSTYGYERPTTPTMDRLAREGVMFERAFASSSWTLPAHASLLTGRYPFEHGAENDPYDGRFATIGDELQKHGYRTAAFSANTVWFSRRRGLGQGFIHFEDHFSTVEDMAARTLYGRKFKKFVLLRLGYNDWPARKTATQITDSALAWLSKNSDLPYFAFLNYFDVHDPYLPPAPYRTKFSKMQNPGGQINEYILRNQPKLTSEQLQGEVDAYDGALLYVDTEIARLLSALEKNGAMKNTIVVVTSDHGEFFGEHGLFVHRNALYRESVHVPLILHWPGKIPAGVKLEQPVSNTSLPATLFELMERKSATEFPVPSLAPLWSATGAAIDWPAPLMELDQMPYEPLKGQPAYSGRMKSLVTSEWQYILHEKDGGQLFHWQADPKQQNNSASTPTGSAVAAEMRKRLQDTLRRTDIFGPKKPDN